MSLNFSDTTNKNGILQVIERKTKLGDGGITGNTQRLKEFTSEVNLAQDKFMSIAMKASAKWQYDDSNHTDYPIITTNLASGQRDYPFTTDEQGNIILDIYKVMVRTSATGQFVEIPAVDQQSDENMSSFYDGNNSSGIPTRYDKTGNGIFLDVIPNYNSTGGLKVFINREASRFVTTDTTKKPGFSGLFHKYLAVVPAYEYACTNQLANKNDLKQEMLELEQEIKEHYTARDRDTKKRLTANRENNR